ncbi:MAG: hypothetical protein V7K88_27340 [Nostoc sp.]|uniref:hypothetical protein n=1 Tax=Nostoc sp. TaxID=1180 RepID=UPI002FF5E191
MRLYKRSPPARTQEFETHGGGFCLYSREFHSPGRVFQVDERVFDTRRRVFYTRE